ncbi:ClbS/DfsB family four-helix bundle protein [Aggregatibacter kilianii]|uniref:ClbS/DfsB family four-helix bundle protein n=1 Tax=Aggregatibacter kilianii TaxID=2025884 RepID=UPI000D6573E2|nr:ClbS/DfsB family four-helix bundle protein [Aggregatibacter kilianii]
MRSYQDKSELIEAIQTSLQKYLLEFEDIDESMKDQRLIAEDKTPSEHLSYQLGWVNSLLGWERDEQVGKTVHTPAEGYKWNHLGELYQHFYHVYSKYSLAEQQRLLKQSVAKLYTWIDTLSETELFQPEQRRWATTSAKWALWKWIHINTVAPFTNFRSKIRKWKKVAGL